MADVWQADERAARVRGDVDVRVLRERVGGEVREQRVRETDRAAAAAAREEDVTPPAAAAWPRLGARLCFDYLLLLAAIAAVTAGWLWR